MIDIEAVHKCESRRLTDEIERLEEQYQEVARVLGSRTFSHEAVMDRARELRNCWDTH